jgi:hypothetical protein
MLWHQETGPILTASMNEYQMIEANNMQPDPYPLSMPLTPRIELRLGKALYMNISDQSAKIEVENTNDLITVKTQSKLVNGDQQSPPQGEINCRVNYLFSDRKVTIQFWFDKTAYSTEAKIILPVISKSGEKISLNSNSIDIDKQLSKLKITSNRKIDQLPTTTGRLFNFVPGLEAVPLGINGNNAEVTIEVI